MERTTWECVLLAGLGGMMPTLSKLGTALIADPSSPLPAFGFFIGLAIYFLVGAVMSYAIAERNLKHALFAGIAAPALIASGISGATGVQVQPPSPNNGAMSAPVRKVSSLLDIMVPSASAETNKPEASSSVAKPPLPQPLKQSVAQPKFKYSLVSFPAGSSDWAPNAVPFRVTLKDQDGKILQFVLPSMRSTLSFYSAKPIAAVKLGAEDFESVFVPLSSNKGGSILVTPYIETKKDLLWALGGKGAPVVRDFSAEIQQAEEH